MPAPVCFAERHDAELHAHNEHLRAAADIQPGQRVLDIGCGAGQTTRQAGRAAAPGHALGIDISVAAIERASELTTAEGPANVTYEVGDAQEHDLAAGGYDIAISRFGTMFFADPPAAFRDIASALAPQGRLVLLVWQERARNQWIMDIDAALGITEPPAAGSGMFSLGDPGATTALLEDAGFGEVNLAEVREPVVLGADPDDAAEFVRGWHTGAGPGRDALERLQALLVEHHIPGRGVCLDSRAWLVTAQRVTGKTNE